MDNRFDFLKGKLISGIIYPKFFRLSLNDIVLNVGCGEGPQAITYKGQYKRMVGIDIQEGRLNVAKEAMKHYGIVNFEAVLGDVENMPFKNNEFDKVLAVDIIEHVLSPEKVIGEIHRTLKDGGEVLITFPMMHDVYTGLASWFGKNILRRKKEKREGWDPNIHHQRKSFRNWDELMKKNGFVFVKSRTSTLFPPFHYIFGWPRFWFSNRYIHAVDNFLSKLPLVKRFGQTKVCIYKKSNKI